MRKRARGFSISMDGWKERGVVVVRGGRRECLCCCLPVEEEVEEEEGEEERGRGVGGQRERREEEKKGRGEMEKMGQEQSGRERGGTDGAVWTQRGVSRLDKDPDHSLFINTHTHTLSHTNTV